MYKILALTILTINFAFAGESITGHYSYVTGTDNSECPSVTLSVKGNDLEGYSLYGATALGAIGPFVNRFYFTEVNNGEVREGNYIYKTEAKNDYIIKNVKFIINGKVLIEEEVSFEVQHSMAILEHKLLKNDLTAQQWRHPSFKCIYEKLN